METIDRRACEGTSHGTYWAARKKGCTCTAAAAALKERRRIDHQARRGGTTTPRMSTSLIYDEINVETGVIRAKSHSGPPPVLSLAERRAVAQRLAADHWSTKQIAAKLGVDERSARAYQQHQEVAA